MKEKRTARPPLIALLTDFGHHDNYVGVMKGVILNIAANTRFVDICHEIPPGEVRPAAFLLERSWDYFPPETVFLVVVDPGVGSERRALAMRAGRSYFVGPDNGVFSFVLDRSEKEKLPLKIVSLSNSRYWLPDISKTFHGRDIFAPVAAHLASGTALGSLGEPVTEAARIPPPRVVRQDQSLEGEIVYVDRFGNLVTSISADELDALSDAKTEILVEVAGKKAGAVGQTYTSVEIGAPVSVIGGFGCLEISVNGGSASDHFRAELGDAVFLRARGAGRREKGKKSGPEGKIRLDPGGIPE